MISIPIKELPVQKRNMVIIQVNFVIFPIVITKRNHSYFKP